MDWLTGIFAHVCGQGRCFVVDEVALPVCQRCLGLYVGAAMAGLWLAAGGAWRRGLPVWGVFVVQAGALAAALLGGLHVIDAGPAWRLTCGLWTGQVAVAWLVGAAGQLRVLSGASRRQLPWRRRDRAAALGLTASGPLLAMGFGRLAWLGWWFWTAAAVVGAVALGLAVAAALASAAAWAVGGIRRRGVGVQGV